MEYLEKTAKMPAFWFVTSPRVSDPGDGRVGYGYCAPFLASVAMVLRNLFRPAAKRAHWRKHRGLWDAGDDTYEPARIIRLASSGSHGIEDAPNLPRWMIYTEMRCRRTARRARWQWRKTRRYVARFVAPKCRHTDVTADLLEGGLDSFRSPPAEGENTMTMAWCRDCGACQISGWSSGREFSHGWRLPRDQRWRRPPIRGARRDQKR